MSQATNNFETSILQLIFQNSNIANIGDATGLRGSTTAGSLYVSLHTASPGEAGDQTTNETSYTNYLRSGGAVARSASGWAVSGNVADNVSAITYATCGTTGATISHFGIGASSTGAGTLLFYGSFTTSKTYNDGDTPVIPAGQLDITAD